MAVTATIELLKIKGACETYTTFLSFPRSHPEEQQEKKQQYAFQQFIESFAEKTHFFATSRTVLGPCWFVRSFFSFSTHNVLITSVRKAPAEWNKSFALSI